MAWLGASRVPTPASVRNNAEEEEEEDVFLFICLFVFHACVCGLQEAQLF